MNYKKIVASVVFAVGALANLGVAQALPSPSVTQVSGNEYAYFNGTTTTNYDLSTVVYDGTQQSQISSTVWYAKNVSLVNMFAAAVANNLGTPNDGIAPYFQYNSSAVAYWTGTGVVDLNNSHPLVNGQTYALASVHSGGAPEIDGSLAPKVGFLLGCLFLMFGRKKQNTEPMMTA